MLVEILLSLRLFVQSQDAAFEVLVRELGSREFATREAATKRLSASPLALPHVRRAMWAGTLEQQTRARKIEAAILAVTLPKREAELLRKARAWGEAGRLDLVAEVCSRPEFQTVERCEALFAAGNAVYATVGQREDRLRLDRDRKKRLELSPAKKKRLMPPDGDPKTAAPDVPLFAANDRSVSTSQPLFLGSARERMDAVLGGRFATLLSGGPLVARLYRDYGSVVVADGDLTLTEHNKGPTDLGGSGGASVFIVNGNIRITPDKFQLNESPGLSDCVFLAAGDVTLDSPLLSASNCRVIAGGKVKFFGSLPPTENAAEPLAPFKFFALAEVGLHAADTKGAVTVTKVDAKSPMGRAKAAAGDVVVAVDGRLPKDVAELRRLVRTGYVLGDCTLVVRRGEETKELVVRFPE